LAKVQKTNNMAFKMKRSPAKNLGDFFGSIFSSKAVKGTGEQLQKGQKERGIFSETAKAEKKSRKAGESKFQADVRRKREKKAEAKKTEAKKTEAKKAEVQPEVNKEEKKGEVKVEEEKAKPTFKQAFAAARKAKKKTFNFEGKSYTTKLKEEIKQPKPTQTSGYFQGNPEKPDFGSMSINPINKKNMRKPFKMKAGKAGPMKKNFGVSPVKNENIKYRKVIKPKTEGEKENQKNTKYFIKSNISNKEVPVDSTTFNKSLYSRFKPLNKKK